MISKEQVLKIAKLARLELTEKEVERMQKDMSAILDYFEVLKKAKKVTVKKIQDGKNELRKDEVGEKSPNLANDLLRAAPANKEGYIKVKTVL